MNKNQIPKLRPFWWNYSHYGTRISNKLIVWDIIKNSVNLIALPTDTDFVNRVTNTEDRSRTVFEFLYVLFLK